LMIYSSRTLLAVTVASNRSPKHENNTHKFAKSHHDYKETKQNHAFNAPHETMENCCSKSEVAHGDGKLNKSHTSWNQCLSNFQAFTQLKCDAQRRHIREACSSIQHRNRIYVLYCFVWCKTMQLFPLAASNK
jgi:hypothetical protein